METARRLALRWRFWMWCHDLLTDSLTCTQEIESAQQDYGIQQVMEYDDGARIMVGEPHLV
jgi:hypothetical protein